MFDLHDLWSEYWSHEHAGLSGWAEVAHLRLPLRGPASAGQAEGRIQLEPLMHVQVIFRVIEGVGGFQVCSRSVRVWWTPDSADDLCHVLPHWASGSPTRKTGSSRTPRWFQVVRCRLGCLGAPRFPSVPPTAATGNPTSSRMNPHAVSTHDKPLLGRILQRSFSF